MNSSDKSIIILGAGSLGKMVASTLLDIGYKEEEVGFADDSPPLNPLGIEYLGDIESVINSNNRNNVSYCIAIANNNIRKLIALKYPKLRYLNVIHPSAVVSKYAKLGYGNIILPNVSIDPEAIIENFTVLNKNTTIGHNVIMRNYSQACPGCNLGGDIGEKVFLGLGTIVIPGKIVGENSIIGAGSTVIFDIPKNCTAIGTPAIPIKFHG